MFEHDDMIQTFVPYGTNQRFDVRRLPRRTRRNPNFFQSQSHGASLEFQAVDAIAVIEQDFVDDVKAKASRSWAVQIAEDLLNHIKVESSVTMMRKDNEDIE